MYIGTKGAFSPPFSLNGVDGMSAKQDRAAPRTVADIERKYNFGKSFAEVMGLIDDTREEVDAVSSELKDKVSTTSLSRTTEEIVAKATTYTNDSISALSSTVETKMDSQGVSISAMQEGLENGLDQVKIKGKDFVFNSSGLSISDPCEEMSNLLDNSGMYVKRSGKEMLTANSDGVTATDLHAKTYLKIGSGDGRSRFEDYGTNRTGCFWTGG